MNQFSGGAAEVEERNASVLQPNPCAAERDAAAVSMEQMPAGCCLPPPAQQVSERRGTNRAIFLQEITHLNNIVSKLL